MAESRKLSAVDQAEFKREMCLSAQALALCWDTLLGVLSIQWMLPLEAQEQRAADQMMTERLSLIH